MNDTNKRETVTFCVDGIGTFEMYVYPTLREQNQIEREILLFLGEDEYYRFMERINELQLYRKDKNEQLLTPEVYERMRIEFEQFLAEPAPEEPERIEAYNKKLQELTSQFYHDPKIGVLFQLLAQMNRVREIATYVVTLVSPPKGFSLWDIQNRMYDNFRQAAEDCLRKFWKREKNIKTAEAHQS